MRLHYFKSTKHTHSRTKLVSVSLNNSNDSHSLAPFLLPSTSFFLLPSFPLPIPTLFPSFLPSFLPSISSSSDAYIFSTSPTFYLFYYPVRPTSTIHFSLFCVLLSCHLHHPCRLFYSSASLRTRDTYRPIPLHRRNLLVSSLFIYNPNTALALHIFLSSGRYRVVYLAAWLL